MAAGKNLRSCLEMAGKSPCSFVCEYNERENGEIYTTECYIVFISDIRNGTSYVDRFDASHKNIRDAAMLMWGYVHAVDKLCL